MEKHESSDFSSDQEDVEGLETESESWEDYPIDDLLIRHESRTIHGVIQRIKKGGYVMDPEFQRDFIWTNDKQSRLIESVLMRIPLPVFYLAEDDQGHMIVVDGLQRLSTFVRFFQDQLKLKLPNRKHLNGLRFSELESKFKNRFEDCNLIIYSIDSKVPERARLDIFDRVNSGVPLTRQQMRNSLFSGDATRFLKKESGTEIFLKATGKSLNKKTMRDREFVNRFCAFQLLGVEKYNGDMDDFLARCLRKMNTMESMALKKLSRQFQQGLDNNFLLFQDHAFRRYERGQERRSVLNASFWDVMSTGLSRIERNVIENRKASIREAIYGLLRNEEFINAITYGSNDLKKVRKRFNLCHNLLQETLGVNKY